MYTFYTSYFNVRHSQAPPPSPVITLRNRRQRCKAAMLAGVQTCTRVGTLIVAAIYFQLIQNRYMFRNFTVLHCSHQHCVQPVASDVEVVGYL